MSYSIPQILLGLIFIIWGLGSAYYLKNGYGQKLSKVHLFVFVLPNKATKFEKGYLLFQSIALTAAGILVLLTKFGN